MPAICPILSHPSFVSAKEILCRERTVSVSLLQVNLRLQYSTALVLMGELERSGVVTPLNAAGFRTLTSKFLPPLPEGPPLNPTQLHAQRVFETALFFRDMYEENNDGDTRAIALVKPARTVSNTKLRQFVLHDLYRGRRLGLTDAALALDAWLQATPGAVTVPQGEVADILRELCAPHERETRDVVIEDEIIARAFMRAARYLRRIATEGVPSHSRVIEFFVPDNLVPTGHGREGGGHREHVVPCVYMRDVALDWFRRGHSEIEVARLLRHYVVIVHITPAQQQRLDGKTNEGVNLKVRMPDDWVLGVGSVFARLEKAGIAFDMPPSFSARV
jgi:hypothetical protein